MAYRGELPTSELPYFWVTGHRPNKLSFRGKSGYSLESRLALVDFAALMLTRVLDKSPRAGVITGMALGWDMAIAEAAHMINLPFVAAVPFAGQDVTWPLESRHRYDALLHLSATVIEVSDPGFSAYKMHKRNEWMVDHGTGGLALWDGTPGGTGSCLEYAQKKGSPVYNCWNLWKN